MLASARGPNTRGGKCGSERDQTAGKVKQPNRPASHARTEERLQSARARKESEINK